jgi:hypothetical protein
VEVNTIESASPEQLVQGFSTYISDPEPNIRGIAVHFVGQAFMMSPIGTPTKQQTIETLLPALEDEDNAHGAFMVLRRSTMFDFSEKAKERLSVIIVKNLSGQDWNRELMVNLIPDFERITKDSTLYSDGDAWFGNATWTAKLALARMGNINFGKECIDLLEKEPDKVLKVTSLLSHIAYTRQEQSIRHIQKYLEDDEVFDKSGEDTGGSVAETALNLLARMIEGFPLPEVEGYTKEQIDQARLWMRTQAKFNIKR